MNFKELYPYPNTYPFPVDFGYGTQYKDFLLRFFESLREHPFLETEWSELIKAVGVHEIQPYDYVGFFHRFCETFGLVYDVKKGKVIVKIKE